MKILSDIFYIISSLVFTGKEIFLKNQVIFAIYIPLKTVTSRVSL